MSNINIDKFKVPDFYNGKSVFITGSTGLVGKILIEKLLYSCSGVDKVYLLIRAKKGDNVSERVARMANLPIYDRLRKENKEQFKKLIPVEGNILEENLGLSYDDLKSLEENVSVVFHLGATVNFDEALKDALAINVKGTEKVIRLCHKMKKLQAFIHVSTTFNNIDRTEIEEQVYYSEDSLEHLWYMAEKYADDSYIMKKILGNRPNTYTYTKALAEELVAKECKNLPVAILRPSIVIGSYEEPIPGWVDTWNGATALSAGISTGAIKVLHGNSNCVVDLIPVDFVTNLTIVAATKCERSEDIKVYNCCTGCSNPVTTGKVIYLLRNYLFETALQKLLATYTICVSNVYLFIILTFILQTIPAFLYDLWLLVRGKKPRMMKIQETMWKVSEMTHYFSLNEWNFYDNNVRNLLKNMSDEDKRTFNFDVKTINWDTCIEEFVKGVHKYVLKSKRY